MAEPPGFGSGVSATDWTLEQTRALLRLAEDPESFKQVNIVTQIIAGLMNGTLWSNREAKRDELLAKLLEKFKEAGNTVGGGLGAIVSTIYGVDAIGDSVGAIAGGAGTAAARKEAGDSVVKAIFALFDTAGVKSGYQNRKPGTEEQENFARFVGMNWQIQMADLIAEMAANWVPWDVMGGVREIGDKVQKVLGLEDAQEEIMQPLMEKFITAGLEKRFNREILPVDLGVADAVAGYIQGIVKPEVFTAILDNEGIRPDIRKTLIELRAKNLSEADARDLLQRGIWDANDLKPFFIGQGYLEADALRKAALLADDRKWKLKGELLNCKETLFAHGNITEGEFRTYLGTMFYSREEEDLEVEIAKCKASMSRAAKPKAITGSFNVAPARLKPGAAAIMTWNIRNAETVTITGLGTVPNRGERVLYPDISQTYYLDASSDTESERFEAVVVVGDTKELKRPTVTFSASPNRVKLAEPVELKWVTSGADIVTIEQVGPVAEAGATIVFPFLTTIYTIRATNAQGTTTRQDVVFVELPGIDFGRDQRPAISFSITPGVVKASQPQAELNWSITRAEEGELTWPDGHKDTISRNGAMIVTASASGIFTISAKNAFGDTHNQEALIFQGAEEETP